MRDEGYQGLSYCRMMWWTLDSGQCEHYCTTRTRVATITAWALPTIIVSNRRLGTKQS